MRPRSTVRIGWRVREVRGQGLLGRSGGMVRTACTPEGGPYGIANGLEVDAAVRRDRGAEKRDVVRDCALRRRPVALPEHRAALDVHNEEGDGAAGAVGPGSVPRERSRS